MVMTYPLHLSWVYYFNRYIVYIYNRWFIIVSNEIFFVCKLQKLMLAKKEKKKYCQSHRGSKKQWGAWQYQRKGQEWKQFWKPGSRVHDYCSSYSLGIMPLELSEMPTFWSLCSCPQDSKSREGKSKWIYADYFPIDSSTSVFPILIPTLANSLYCSFHQNPEFIYAQVIQT